MTVFADGKPVDKSYRSRRVVNDDDAPEARRCEWLQARNDQQIRSEDA